MSAVTGLAMRQGQTAPACARVAARKSGYGRTMHSDEEGRIAVLIPCYNEEVAIGAVVAAFRAALPGAAIHVFDNNSTDRTIAVAREAGAIVRRETRQGKGAVVRRMFADIEADTYVLVDGDGTYDAASAPRLIATLVEERLDMVCARRVAQGQEAYRAGHRFGNRVLTALVAWLFGRGLVDMLSGYRVFSRRFVKSFPALAYGFETETELTVHALSLSMPFAEVEAPYRGRPGGSSCARSVRPACRARTSRGRSARCRARCRGWRPGCAPNRARDGQGRR